MDQLYLPKKKGPAAFSHIIRDSGLKGGGLQAIL
jgi:hypothetical protein